MLPRALLQFKNAHENNNGINAIKSLSIKLFRFGLLMALLAILFGSWLWVEYNFSGGWLNIKISLVGLLFIYFLYSGWLLLLAVKHNKFYSEVYLRVFNESSLLIVIPIIYLVVSKLA
ncbi:MAG: CopD family protein [Gammaproteobacteria bacterium]|nr:CopD family protein [Gammaproteobacteria bacterium]